jgi:predicted O-methyltransferase YrrM
MFINIPQAILERMRVLEALDAHHRKEGVPKLQALRQVVPETGRFLALLAAGAPEGQFIEVGTSGGYSALWLSLACRARNQKLITFEILPEKSKLARETFALTGTDDAIELIDGDARQLLGEYHRVAFCFLDAEKDVYQACYDLVVANLVPGAWLVADNVFSHQAELQPFVDAVLADDRVDAIVGTIGKGLLVCRKR